jgi:platelet-activating factor acetylhydrolase
MEIEVPVENPRHFSHIKRANKHVLQLETVLMTIYYPSLHDGHEKFNTGENSNRSRELWLGRPRVSIARGYGRFSGVGDLAVPLFLPAMFTKLPAYRNAPVADYWAPLADTKVHGSRVKTMTGTRPDGAPEEPTFPLILFSHGLGGEKKHTVLFVIPTLT